MRLLAAVALLVPALASAQDGDERRRARDFENEVVREIQRGVYVKTNVGSTLFLNTHNQRRCGDPACANLFAGVVTVGLGIGTDFIDRERFSAAFEAQLVQGLFNGPRLTPNEIAFQNLSQGDIHTYTGTVALEASTYLSRRLGIGVRGGGGAMFAPLLVNESEYVNVIQPQLSTPGPAQLHEGTSIMVFGGPTLEYYTKLSHFSVGVDVDVVFVIDFDLGIYPSGYLKYTF